MPHTFPQPPCIPIPPYWPHARRDRRGIAVGLYKRPPPHTCRPLSNFQKTTKSTKSTVPYMSDTHAPQISIHERNPSQHPPRPARGDGRPTQSGSISVLSPASRRRVVRRRHIAPAASRHRHRSGVNAEWRDCPAFAGWPEDRPWSRGPPRGGQPRGGICASFPSVCCTAALLH